MCCALAFLFESRRNVVKAVINEHFLHWLWREQWKDMCEPQFSVTPKRRRT